VQHVELLRPAAASWLPSGRPQIHALHVWGSCCVHRLLLHKCTSQVTEQFLHELHLSVANCEQSACKRCVLPDDWLCKLAAVRKRGVIRACS
jgi:hypothetical protein